MAQRTAASDGHLSTDPEVIRAEMAKTRAALTRELGQLKRVLLGSPGPAPKKKEKKVAQKKPKAASSGKKKSGGKKSASRRSSSKVSRKTKKVLGEMLAGAAVGAVKGAAQAALPDKERKDQNEKSGQ